MILPQILKDASSFIPLTSLHIFIEIETLFDRISYEAHLPSLETAAYGEALTASDILANLNGVYLENLVSLLGDHGIQINLESNPPIKALSLMLSALVMLSSGEVSDLTVSMEDESNDSVYNLSLLLSEITQLPATELYELIDTVDNNLIKKINQTLTPDAVEVFVDSQPYVERYLKYIGDSTTGVVYAFVKKRNHLPLDFIYAVKALGKELSEIDDMTVILNELKALYMASDIAYDSALTDGMDAIANTLSPTTSGSVIKELTKFIMDKANGQ